MTEDTHGRESEAREKATQHPGPDGDGGGRTAGAQPEGVADETRTGDDQPAQGGEDRTEVRGGIAVVYQCGDTAQLLPPQAGQAALQGNSIHVEQCGGCGGKHKVISPAQRPEQPRIVPASEYNRKQRQAMAAQIRKGAGKIVMR